MVVASTCSCPGKAIIQFQQQFCTHCRPCQACLVDSAAARRRKQRLYLLWHDTSVMAGLFWRTWQDLKCLVARCRRFWGSRIPLDPSDVIQAPCACAEAAGYRCKRGGSHYKNLH